MEIHDVALVQGAEAVPHRDFPVKPQCWVRQLMESTGDVAPPALMDVSHKRAQDQALTLVAATCKNAGLGKPCGWICGERFVGSRECNCIMSWWDRSHYSDTN